MCGGDSCSEESDVALPESESDHENDTKSPVQPTGGPLILVPTALDKAHPPGAIDFMDIFSMLRIAPRACAWPYLWPKLGPFEWL